MGQISVLKVRFCGVQALNLVVIIILNMRGRDSKPVPCMEWGGGLRNCPWGRSILFSVPSDTLPAKSFTVLAAIARSLALPIHWLYFFKHTTNNNYSSWFVFRLRALAVGQTDGAGGGAKAVRGTYPRVPSPFSERKKSICPWSEARVYNVITP